MCERMGLSCTMPDRGRGQVDPGRRLPEWMTGRYRGHDRTRARGRTHQGGKSTEPGQKASHRSPQQHVTEGVTEQQPTKGRPEQDLRRRDTAGSHPRQSRTSDQSQARAARTGGGRNKPQSVLSLQATFGPGRTRFPRRRSPMSQESQARTAGRIPLTPHRSGVSPPEPGAALPLSVGAVPPSGRSPPATG